MCVEVLLVLTVHTDCISLALIFLVSMHLQGKCLPQCLLTKYDMAAILFQKIL